MIIRRAFYRESAQSTLGIVAILVVVFVLFGMTAVLGRTVQGEYAQSIVVRLLAWQTVRRVDLLLPLGFYLGVLLTFSRWYRDSEMTVLAACGIGLPQLLRPVLTLAVLVSLLVAGAAFYLTPLSARAIEFVKAEGGQRPELAGITPGAFTDMAAGGRILYAEEVSPDGRMEQVFLNNPQKDRPRVVLAAEAHPFVDARTGDRFVALTSGWAYEGVPGQADYRVVHFDTYSVRIEQKPFVAPPTGIEGTPTAVLFRARDRDASAEWHWRLSKPMLVLVLALYAMVLSYTDARRGRLANLFAAILVYFIYSNVLGFGETMIKKGEVPGVIGLWWVHAVMASVAIFLLYQRARNRPLVPRLQFARSS